MFLYVNLVFLLKFTFLINSETFGCDRITARPLHSL